MLRQSKNFWDNPRKKLDNNFSELQIYDWKPNRQPETVLSNQKQALWKLLNINRNKCSSLAYLFSRIFPIFEILQLASPHCVHPLRPFLDLQRLHKLPWGSGSRSALVRQLWDNFCLGFWFWRDNFVRDNQLWLRNESAMLFEDNRAETIP